MESGSKLKLRLEGKSTLLLLRPMSRLLGSMIKLLRLMTRPLF